MGYQYLADPSGDPRQDGIQRTGDPDTTMPTWVPADPNSTDWQNFQTWLAVGNTPIPAQPAPPSPRIQLGNTFLGAISDLGWWGWMDQGAAAQVAAGKLLDGRYWSTIGKADTVIETDAKLTRVAAAAERARVAASGQAAPAAPLITLAAVMDHGDAMMAAG